LPAVLTLPGKHDAKFNANVKGGQKTTLWAGDRGTSGDRDRGQAGTGTGTSGDRDRGQAGTGAKKNPRLAPGATMGGKGLSLHHFERVKPIFPFCYRGHWPHVEDRRDL